MVAAPSRAAALRAWDIEQDLFATGLARETDDPTAVAAALAHPERVLKRAVGTRAAFAVEARLPKTPPASAPPAKGGKRSVGTPVKSVKPADRRPLDRAQAALAKVEEAYEAEEARQRARQAALDAERGKRHAAYVVRRKAATAAVVEARQAYRKAGGAD